MSIESPVKFLTQSLVAIALVLSSSGNAIAQVSGTALGLAATYDFNLDNSGRTTFYVGPKIELLNASGPNINVSQTKIGLIAGSDFQVSDDFTVGANVTLNLSTSSNIVGLPAGSSLQLGIRAAYQF